MTTPRESLQSEHSQVRLILRMLDTQLNRLRAGEAADYIVLSGAVGFLAEFLSDVHHPKEERMLTILIDGMPEIALAVELLVEEHRRCEYQTTRLLEAVERIQRDTDRPGLVFVTQLTDLIDRQRMLMTLEEKSIFPRMDPTPAKGKLGFQGCAA